MIAMWRVDSIDELLAEISDHFFAWAMFALAFGAAIVGACVALPVEGAEPPQLAEKYRREYVRIIRQEWGLEAPVATLAAQIQQESQWNCTAISHAGAKGCAQFMPSTANWIGDLDSGLRGADVFSPTWAFRAQATYMEWLHARIKASDECNRMAFALAAYNGGLGYVYKRQKASREPGKCFRATCEINPGITPANQRENAEYPVRIMAIEPAYERWGDRVCWPPTAKLEVVR